MEVGQKIREIRSRKGYSQENMAELLGMSVSNYCYIEQGKVSMNINKLEEIALVLETDIFDILSLGEKNVFYIKDNKDSSQNGYIINETLPRNYQKLEVENQSLNNEVVFYKNKIDSLESKLEEVIKLLQQRK